jgi:hypothetical protein
LCAAIAAKYFSTVNSGIAMLVSRVVYQRYAPLPWLPGMSVKTTESPFPITKHTLSVLDKLLE